MKVYLAGYNVDSEVLRQLQKNNKKRDDITPEVISAAYARISRDPRPISQIRKDARNEVEHSRRLNSTIIFKMGHHSVAEHAIFNLDIVGISRLAMEELEKFRLCSYTEKSQRYITLDKDFVIPKEIIGTKLQKTFTDIIEKQNTAYHELFKKLKNNVSKKYKRMSSDPKKHSLLEGWAKEDARYITSLATKSQVGQTINARNLELLLRRFASHPLAEIKDLGLLLYGEISEIAPSIVIFYEANDRDSKTYPELKKLANKICQKKDSQKYNSSKDDVRLVEYARQGDMLIAASLLNTSTNIPYENCLRIAKKLTTKKKKEIFKAAWKHLQFYDSMPREFEYANLTYNITLSAACFGQLKRHRMSTITTQNYDPNLGNTIPETISEIGMKKYFENIINMTNDAYDKINKINPLIAPYVLTNSHKKQVLMRLNARELYHVSRLREDSHAQWDIQNISKSMSSQAKKIMPLTFGMVGGKDNFNKLYKNIYGKLPKITKLSLPGAKKIKN